MDKKINSPFKKYSKPTTVEVQCDGPLFQEIRGKPAIAFVAVTKQVPEGLSCVYSILMGTPVSNEEFVGNEFTKLTTEVVAEAIFNHCGYEGEFTYEAFPCHSEEHAKRMLDYFTKCVNQKTSN